MVYRKAVLRCVVEFPLCTSDVSSCTSLSAFANPNADNQSFFFFLRLLLLVSVSLVPVLDGPCRLLPFNLFPDRLLNSQYRFQFEPRDRKRLNGRQAGIFILTLSSASLLGNEPSTRHAYHLLCVLKICSCRLFAYPFTLCLAFMSVSLRGTTAYFTLKVP